MSSEQEDNKSKYEILNMAWDLYLKVILFIVTVLIFISLIVAFIYMSINEYDPIAIVAVGASNSIFGCGYLSYHQKFI